MDADLFLQQFGHLAQGEGGIKKLRDVILQLAVRGKLVEQNPADEPARVLKERILKSQKTTKKPPAVTQPYDAPSSWEWLSLSQTGQNWGQKTPDSEFTYIDVAAVDNLVGRVSQNPPIVQAADAPSRARKIVKKGTVIYSTVRPYLRNIAVVEQDYYPEAIASTAFAIIHPHDGINPYFLFYYLRSPDFVTYVESEMIGVAYPAINDAKFFAGAFPLPPLAEQKRIVAKVDELMALCDKLEAEQKAQRMLKTQAVQSTLHHLTSADSQASFGTSLNILERTFGNWFDDLATVKHLRATILQLAVQGKLVPQNPTDEPASELLKRIEAEKKRLVKEGKIKAPKNIITIAESNMAFPIPSNWKWIRLVEAGIVSTGGTPRTNEVDLYGNDIPFIGPGQITQSGRILEADKGLSEKGRNHTSIAKIGDILMVCIGGSIGKAAIADKETGFNQQINCLSCLLIENRYAYIALTAPSFFSAVLEKATGSATPIINLSKWSEIPIPLPPLAEQKRIVAKVDELMTLCDQLEADITHTQTLNIHLMDSLIHRMTEAA